MYDPAVQVDASLRSVDKAVARLMDGLVRLRLHTCANIIILSDHGLFGPLPLLCELLSLVEIYCKAE